MFQKELGRRPFLSATGGLAGLSVLPDVGKTEDKDHFEDAGGSSDELLVGVNMATTNVKADLSGKIPSGVQIQKTNDKLGYALVKITNTTQSSNSREKVADRLAEKQNIEYVEPNGTKEAFLTPNDDLFGDQYAPQQVNAPSAWDTTQGSSIKIGIVDQGVKYDHDDIAAAFGTNKGYDFVDDDDDPYPDDIETDDDDGDYENHGTHVAGIAAARTDNGTGIAGISNAALLSVRVLSESGFGYWSDIADGVQYAADVGCDVINLSLGGIVPSTTINRAIQYASDNGVLPVAAAGNLPFNDHNYPAAYDNVLAVAATNSDKNQAYFSSHGKNWVDVFAPGVSVLSLGVNTSVDSVVNDRSPYEYLSGTSMASPVVAGVAALVMDAKGLNSAQTREHIVNTSIESEARPDPAAAGGLVDAHSAVTEDFDHTQAGDHFGEAWSGTPASGHGLALETTTGDGLYAKTTGTDPTDAGVFGVSTAEQGYGVHGRATATSGRNYGLWGLSKSSEGTGLYGKASASSGGTIGVRGIAQSPDGRGVSGANTASSGKTTGTYGAVSSSDNGAAGVRGYAAADSGTIFGVYGETKSPDGYGLYTPNDAKVGSTLYATNLEVTDTKNFVQTVTTEAGPREIVYTSVESPTPRTETSGIATLQDGRAVVELPDHFALVTDPDEDLVVQVTPHSIEAEGPAVVERSPTRLVIEDFEASGDYDVSYTIKGTRDGYADQDIVRKTGRQPSPESPDGPKLDD